MHTYMRVRACLRACTRVCARVVYGDGGGDGASYGGKNKRLSENKNPDKVFSGFI